MESKMNENKIVLSSSKNISDSFICSIEEFSLKHKIIFDKSKIIYITLGDKKFIDESFNNLPNNSNIFIDKIGSIGHSLFYILKRIKACKDKNITLHIVDQNLSLHLQNNMLFGVLESLYQFESSRIEHRTSVARDTREKKNIKLGRKKGSTGKSKYDKHKRRILFLHKQGVPNTRIVKDIDMGTPQSLGKYIKQVKLQNKIRQRNTGTYLITDEDLKNINKFGS